MATRKQREIIRQRRMAFDRTVEANRKNANRKNADLRAETDEPTNNTKVEEKPLKSTKKGSQSKAKATKGKKKE